MTTVTMDAQSGNYVAPGTSGVFGTVFADKFVGQFESQTGVFNSITTDYLTVNKAGYFVGPTLFSGAVNALGDVSVVGDIALGGDLVPLNPSVDDTMFIDASLNVANVFTIDKETGQVVVQTS